MRQWFIRRKRQYKKYQYICQIYRTFVKTCIIIIQLAMYNTVPDCPLSGDNHTPPLPHHLPCCPSNLTHATLWSVNTMEYQGQRWWIMMSLFNSQDHIGTSLQHFCHISLIFEQRARGGRVKWGEYDEWTCWKQKHIYTRTNPSCIKIVI